MSPRCRRRRSAANAPDLTPSSVAGVWNVSVSGQSCQVATSQTKFGEGYRAGPLRCPAPVDGVKSWNVAGKQLSLYDESGSVVARLYSSGAGEIRWTDLDRIADLAYADRGLPDTSAS